MLMLGPMGEGTRRAQCRKWIACLDAAKLDWWQRENRRSSMKIARERVQDGALPPVLLEKACHAGMKQLALVYPYVLWGAGPWDVAPGRRHIGFWPQRGMMMRALHRGTMLRRASSERGWGWHERGQKWWLVVEAESYSVYGLYGDGEWCMQGRWSSPRW